MCGQILGSSLKCTVGTGSHIWSCLPFVFGLCIWWTLCPSKATILCYVHQPFLEKTNREEVTFLFLVQTKPSGLGRTPRKGQFHQTKTRRPRRVLPYFGQVRVSSTPATGPARHKTVSPLYSFLFSPLHVISSSWAVSFCFLWA